VAAKKGMKRISVRKTELKTGMSLERSGEEFAKIMDGKGGYALPWGN